MTLTDNPRVDIEKRIRQIETDGIGLTGFKAFKLRKELAELRKQLKDFDKAPNLDKYFKEAVSLQPNQVSKEQVTLSL